MIVVAVPLCENTSRWRHVHSGPLLKGTPEFLAFVTRLIYNQINVALHISTNDTAVFCSLFRFIKNCPLQKIA